MDLGLNLSMFWVIHCKCCLLKSQHFRLNVCNFIFNFFSYPVHDGFGDHFCILTDFPVLVRVLSLKHQTTSLKTKRQNKRKVDKQLTAVTIFALLWDRSFSVFPILVTLMKHTVWNVIRYSCALHSVWTTRKVKIITNLRVGRLDQRQIWHI